MPPDPWEPTGTPVEQVMWPAVAPTKANRTAALWNNGLKKDDPWYGMHLWLTKVSTGWNLGGSYGQSRNNRIFYPRNLSQQHITIEGQMPNQHQYDRLVRFVRTHHETALDRNDTLATQSPVTFALPEALWPLPYVGPKRIKSSYRNDAYYIGTGQHRQVVRRYYRSMYVDGYIVGIRAGHPRWNFAPRFTMQLLVSYDNIDEKVELATQMTKLLQTKGATYSQSNDQITANYRRLLKITPGSVNDPSKSPAGDKEFVGPLIPILEAADGFPQWKQPDFNIGLP